MAEKMCGIEKGQFLTTKPTYWNTSDTWSDANKSYYIRQGNIVTVFCKKSGSNLDVNFYQLPSGYRPVGFQFFPGSNGEGAFAGLLIEEDGNMRMATSGNKNYCWTTANFYTDDPFPYSDLA